MGREEGRPNNTLAKNKRGGGHQHTDVYGHSSPYLVLALLSHKPQNSYRQR